MIIPKGLRIGQEIEWVEGTRARIVGIDRVRGWYTIRHFASGDARFPTGVYGQIKAGEFYPRAWVFIEEKIA